MSPEHLCSYILLRIYCILMGRLRLGHNIWRCINEKASRNPVSNKNCMNFASKLPRLCQMSAHHYSLARESKMHQLTSFKMHPAATTAVSRSHPLSSQPFGDEKASGASRIRACTMILFACAPKPKPTRYKRHLPQASASHNAKHRLAVA